MVPQLCGKECVDLIMRRWHAMSFEHKLDPKYSISAPYWHTVVDAECAGRCAGDFLRTGAREPTSELSASNDDAAEDDDDPELPDLLIETANTSWSTGSPSPEKWAPAEADETSDQARCR